MTSFTRITVVGTSRRATLVVPAEEPLATLIPDIAKLLQEQNTTLGGALTMISLLGDEVDLGSSCDEQQIVDGQVLRLVRVEDAPPPPEVTDVTDAIAETLDHSVARWGAGHREVAGALGVGALVLAGTLAPGLNGPLGWEGIVVFTVATIVAAAIGRFTRFGGIAATAAALGAVPAAAVGLAAMLPGTTDTIGATGASASLLFGFAWLAIGLGFGVGQRSRPPMVGAAAGVALALVALALAAFDLPAAGIAGIIAVLVTAGIGVLPVLALNLSRVATLDDMAIAGEPLERVTVRTRVATAYGMFGWGVYALAIAAAAASVVLLGDHSIWSPIVGSALVLVLLLRTRVVPLATQAWPLWVAGFIGPLLALGSSGPTLGWATAVVTATAVVLVVTLVLARPRAHTRVRLRRLGDALEGLAVLAMVPAVLGIFNVYALVFGAF